MILPKVLQLYRITGKTASGFMINEIVQIQDDDVEEFFFTAKTLYNFKKTDTKDHNGDWVQMKSDFSSFLDGTHENFKFSEIDMDDYPELFL